MTPATVSQTNTIAKPTKGPSSAHAPESASEFASLFEKSLKPSVPANLKAANTLLEQTPIDTPKKGTKVPKELAGLPLDFQGSDLLDEKNAKLVSLSDLLASVSHESKAPQGTSVLNLKNVLAYNNDNPELINKDLVQLLPKKDQKAATEVLINGAKKLLHDRLIANLPEERIPKTLKGMIETAIRFSIAISDIKVETLPQSKISSEILTAFAAKQEALLPATPKSKIDLKQNASKEHLQSKNVTAEKASSPLEQMLAQSSPAAAVTSTVAVATAATALSTAKEIKPESKSESKKSSAVVDSKVEIKEESNQELLKTATSVNSKESVAPQKIAHKESVTPLEQSMEKEQIQKSDNEAQTTNHTVRNEATQKSETALDVKMGEARQLMRQLSSEVKEAIDNYKPPFMKLSMKLNPERLGEIDVAIIKRGDKVHVNLSSNQGVLQLLQNQSAELKTALTNAGLADASMNFSQSGSGNKEQQNNNHSTAQKYQEMAALEDQIDMLELIIPQYG